MTLARISFDEKKKMARLKMSCEYSIYESNHVAELTVELFSAVSIIAASVNLVHEKKGTITHSVISVNLTAFDL